MLLTDLFLSNYYVDILHKLESDKSVKNFEAGFKSYIVNLSRDTSSPGLFVTLQRKGRVVLFIRRSTGYNVMLTNKFSMSVVNTHVHNIFSLIYNEYKDIM